MTKPDSIIIRDYREEDKNLVLSTFLRGVYHGGSPFSEMPKQLFMHHYHRVAEHFLTNHKIVVACLDSDINTVLGYAMLVPGTDKIAYVFVKKPWRGIGIAKKLVPDNIKFFTHYTKVGLSIARKKGWHFNPFYN